MTTNTLSLLERCKTALIELPFDSGTLIKDLEAAIAAERSVSEAEPKMSLPVRILAITTAYEQGFGKGQKKTVLECPYTKGDWLGCDIAWQLGYDEGVEKPNAPTAKPSQVNSQEPVACQWVDGAPPFPYNEEWFIAKLTNSEGKVVLRRLPESYSYDFTTVDQTYYKSERIKQWMQFPDSEFKSPQLKPLSDEEIVKKELDAIWQAIEDADDGEQPAYRHCQEIVRERARAIEAKLQTQLGAHHG